MCPRSSSRGVMVVCDSPLFEHYLHWPCANGAGNHGPRSASSADRSKAWWCSECKIAMPQEWQEQETLDNRMEPHGPLNPQPFQVDPPQQQPLLRH
jgi:hypothetical protein